MTEKEDISLPINIVKEDSDFYFTAEQLKNTPSIRDGFTEFEEDNQRQLMAVIICEMGKKLKLAPICINTAAMYMHRFLMFHSLKHFQYCGLEAACIFVASKVVHKKIYSLSGIVSLYNYYLYINSKKKPELTLKQQMDELILHESLILATLNFRLDLIFPHFFIILFLKKCSVPKFIADRIYVFATHVICSTKMCLRYTPKPLACFIIFQTCMTTNWEIASPSENPWFKYIDKNMTKELLDEMNYEYSKMAANMRGRLSENQWFNKFVALLTPLTKNSSKIAEKNAAVAEIENADNVDDPVTASNAVDHALNSNPVTASNAVDHALNGNPVTASNAVDHALNSNPVTASIAVDHAYYGNPVTASNAVDHALNSNPVTASIAVDDALYGNPVTASIAVDDALYGNPVTTSIAVDHDYYGNPVTGSNAFDHALYGNPVTASIAVDHALYSNPATASNAVDPALNSNPFNDVNPAFDGNNVNLTLNGNPVYSANATNFDNAANVTNPADDANVDNFGINFNAGIADNPPIANFHTGSTGNADNPVLGGNSTPGGNPVKAVNTVNTEYAGNPLNSNVKENNRNLINH